MKRLKFLSAAASLVVAVAAGAAPFVALDRARAARLGDAAKHTDPTIVTMWSSDCVYCKKNLEVFAAMARADARLRLVTVAVESDHVGLAAPLDRLAVPGARFAYGNDAPEAIAYAIDKKWRGELPRTLLFDGRGGRRALSGVVTEDDARAALGLAVR